MPAQQPLSNREILNGLLWQLNLVNVEAAELCGVSERTIYRWLSGDSKVPPGIIKMLQMTLDLRKRDTKA
jgi:predicted transcriptional regulator